MKLSPTQHVVIKGILNGRTFSSLARELGLSESSINYHLRRSFLILNAHSRIELYWRYGEYRTRAGLSEFKWEGKIKNKKREAPT